VLDQRRQRLSSGPWRYLHQCHGDGVALLGPHEPCEGREADALVSSLPGRPLAVFSADCAVVGLASPNGIVAAVHAGWRGLFAGVVEQAAATMVSAGADELLAVVGACIGPECYEFGEADLEPLAARYGPSVAAKSAKGTTALDLRAGVHRALEAAGAVVVAEDVSCTSCDTGFFSWRARRDLGRQALVIAAAP
jgi:YfiH family protein